MTEAVIQTRQRLLDAAGEIFADRGYHGAMVRDIVTKAGANIAAVNYHFRDKEGLYREVLRYAHQCAAAAAHFEERMTPDDPPEQKLAGFVHAMVYKLLDSGRPAWHEKLLAREMVEPTAALDELVEQEIRPRFAMLRGIVSEIVGISPEDERVRWLAASIIAQCLFFQHNRPVIQRLYPDLVYSAEHISQIADNIARFSLDGLRGAAIRLRGAAAEGGR